ncbi:GntR family transcriptional regulator [Pseudonocardia bannensis]|uniref:GntR family transcriptional regulator n=1 Tax=Pseudonocardia bannensis TaxID=630973 RepID=A0A848DJG0_9PSEU|nr:GntR family transcriptional regulator [Pseudonocardia bannensis]NMH92705.1 GntR family transcriptional regulator [Pseudonocardia bannensis]
MSAVPSIDGPALALGRVATRSDLVAESLRAAILAGRLRPGQTLVERHLAAMLGVSKTPVREALIALTASGLIVMSRHAGAVVRTLSAPEVRTIYELRLLLEPWAVGRAARRHGPAAAAEARAALDEAEAGAAAGDPVAVNLANRRFHRALYSRADNELVTAQLDRVQDLVALALQVAQVWRGGARPFGQAERAEHAGIVAAVAAGESERAEALARAHVEHAAAALELPPDGSGPDVAGPVAAGPPGGPGPA